MCDLTGTTNDSEISRTAILDELVPRILVVDDDELIRNFLWKMLTLQGYCVDVSEGGGSALEKMIDHRYQVVLLDIVMPGMSGHEILRYCKNHLPETEIIIISGNSEIDIAVETVKNGAFDFIQKPFTTEKILAKIKGAIKKYHENISISESLLANPFGAGGISNETSKILHNYKVIRAIGSGNMGVVLLVEKNGRKYAMKIMRKDSGNSNKYALRVQRFLREAKVLSQIRHPNIVEICDYGFPQDKDVPFIVMEYIIGRELIELIKEEEKLTIKNKLWIISQIAMALDHIHKLKILHRDIKPSNIIVDDQLNVKLTDFGVARVNESSLTMTNEALGTPAYMAPESFEYNHNVDHRADIFSLGILSYELITGRKPFTGRTVTEMMVAIHSTRPIEPSKLVPGLPGDIQDILAGMLRKNPKERFESCEQIINALNSFYKKDQKKTKPSTSRILHDFLFPGDRVWQ